MPEYRFDTVDGAGIDATGELLTLTADGRETVSVHINADVSSDFALEVDFGDGTWIEWATYNSTASVTDTQSVAARKVRVVNNTAQTSSDTADVKLGAN